MKKCILIFLFFPTLVFSQAQIGLRSGYTLSSIAFKPDNKSKIIPGEGVDLGLIVKHFDNKWVGFQGEMYLTHRGYQAPFADTINIKRVNSYLELPIFFQTHLKISSLFLHANVGCYAAYLLSAKEGYDSTGSWSMDKVKFNVLKDNRFDYGLAGGVGLSYEFKWGTIQAEVRIMYGYGDLFDHTYSGMPKESKSVVQNVNISYMYSFSRIAERRKEKEKNRIHN